MYIIDLINSRSLDGLENVVAEHRRYLEAHREAGLVLFYGPKTSGAGGIVVTREASREELDQLIEQDPFVREGLVERSVTGFVDARS
jgi:uncharacterized protein YciI